MGQCLNWAQVLLVLCVEVALLMDLLLEKPVLTFTESQNHRVVGVGRHPWRSFSPTPAQAGSPRAGDTSRWVGDAPEREAP